MMHYYRKVANLRFEIFKTINSINPKFMKDIFRRKSNAKVRPFVIIVKLMKVKPLSLSGIKSLTALGPKMWNHLPTEVKSETSF